MARLAWSAASGRRRGTRSHLGGHMLAKRIFLVSASILALMIAHQLGVTAARGQVGGTVASATEGGSGSAVVTSSGSVYFSIYGTTAPVAPRWTFKGTVP